MFYFIWGKNKINSSKNVPELLYNNLHACWKLKLRTLRPLYFKISRLFNVFSKTAGLPTFFNVYILKRIKAGYNTYIVHHIKILLSAIYFYFPKDFFVKLTMKTLIYRCTFGPRKKTFVTSSFYSLEHSFEKKP